MDEHEMIGIIYRIKSKRNALGLSYQDLSDRTGISKSTLQRYETGFIRNLPVDKLETLAEALETTPSYLMGWERETPPNMIVAESSPIYEAENITTAEEAIEVLLRQPTLMTYGGYDTKDMTEEDLVSFANDVLQQLKLVSHKYKK